MSKNDLDNLRGLADYWWLRDAIVSCALAGAADEIERLRALVEFYEQGGKTLEQVESEISKLNTHTEEAGE